MSLLKVQPSTTRSSWKKSTTGKSQIKLGTKAYYHERDGKNRVYRLDMGSLESMVQKATIWHRTKGDVERKDSSGNIQGGNEQSHK